MPFWQEASGCARPVSASTLLELEGDTLGDDGKRLLTLLETTGRRLHVLLVRLTQREDVAEDLMQELFLKLTGGAAIRELAALLEG